MRGLTKKNSLDMRRRSYLFGNLENDIIFRIVSEYSDRLLRSGNESVCRVEKLSSDKVMMTIQPKKYVFDRFFSYVFQTDKEYDSYCAFCQTIVRKEKINNLLN